MRLHGLSLTAFGPFAGTETIDFDALNDTGLFLLTGATGAGKTSILDAVCFALYGTVPGVRGVKALKSQHADDLTAPEVVLDFSVRERRFRIRRSPEWSRPKRRGSGTRVEPARASLLELTDGEERLVSSRAAEVGLEVCELIGMRAAQFQQVAMLPQGEFARFLHASSQDRHDVLQQLFQTDRFSRIEEWVHEHSRSLREEAGDLERDVRRLLDLAAERAAVPLPDELCGDALAVAAGTPTVRSWLTDRVAEATTAAQQARERHDAASATLTGARTRCEAARLRRRLQERRDDALARRHELERTAGEAAAAADRIDADRRARACLPILALAEPAADDVRRLRLELDEPAGSWATLPAALRRLAEHRGVPSDERDEAEGMLPGLAADPALPGADGLRARASGLRRLADDLRAVLPQVRRLQTDSERLERLREQIAAARAEIGEQETLLEGLPEVLSDLGARLDEQRSEAARVEALELQVGAAQDRARAAAALPAAIDRLAALEGRARDLRDAEADARERVLRLTERRLEGMAAELAGALQDGDPCQVCGSTTHPEPAVPSGRTVSAEEQDAAAAAHELARQRHQQTLADAAEARRDAEELRRRAEGQDAAPAEEELARLRTALSDARAARAGVVESTARLSALEARQDAAARRLQESAVLLAAEERAAQELEQALRSGREEAAATVGGDVEVAAVPQILAALDAEIDRIERRLELCTAHGLAVARLAQLHGEAARAAAEHGFDGVTEVHAVILDDTERDRLEDLLARRSDAAARVEAVLDDPELAAGLEHAGPADVARAETAVVDAETVAAEAARRLHHCEQLAEHLTDLDGRLATAMDAWTPLRERHLRADSMARLVRGMGHDNQLQMRLSAYVLARRLDQVLDAANERLTHMRDHRYQLRRTARAARRSSQAGLGLEVLDQWTGEVREPSTLSGGETFVVSLALALGLADVVTQEAGGTEIETLFVDEGFGTLDAETLDDVMDRLDSLRAGGRSVGVVSHVGELRTRIPTQLHVRKTPHGSSVQARMLVG